MTARNYGQACSVARFLDVLGTRWTLLIVRDLLARPRRFKELLASAPSMGPNLLSVRLRELGEAGIVEKTRAPGQVEHYTLTEKGRALEPVIHEMVRWSLQYVATDPDDPGVSRPDLLVVAFAALFDPAGAKGIDEAYELHVDEVVFHLNVKDGSLETGAGPAEDPAFIMTTSARTLDQLGTGATDMETELEKGEVTIAGDVKAVARFADAFGGIRE